MLLLECGIISKKGWCEADIKINEGKDMQLYQPLFIAM